MTERSRFAGEHRRATFVCAPRRLAGWLALAAPVMAGCGQILDKPGGQDGGAPLPAPAVPSLRSPWNGLYTGSVHSPDALRPTFHWAAVPSATSYDLALDSSCDPASFRSCPFSNASVAGGITTTSFRPPDALPVATSRPVGARFYWRMRACNAAGCSDWTDVRYLNVGRLADDFDGDGYSDLSVATFQDNKVFHYQGSASGLVTTPRVCFGDPSWSHYGNALAIGDFNGDGFGDAAFAADTSDGAGLVAVALGGPSGLPCPVTQYIALTPPAGVTEFGRSLAGPGDLDGDGFDDLVEGGSSATALYVVSGGKLGFAAPVAVAVPTGFTAVSVGPVLAAGGGDLDGDGYIDTAFPVSQPQNQQVSAGFSVLRGGPNGVTAPAGGVFTQPVLGSFGTSLAIGDFDGDGLADVFAGATDKTAPEPSSFGFVYRGAAGGPPSGTMTMLANPAVGRAFGQSSAEVVRAGTATALVVSDDNAGAVYVFLGGQLATTVHDSSSGRRYGISVGGGDFSGDGFTDLVVGATDQPLPNQGPSAGSVFIYGWTAAALQAMLGTQLGDSTSTDANESFGTAITP